MMAFADTEASRAGDWLRARGIEGKSAPVQSYQLYIGGKWEDPASGEWFETVNPFDERPWARIPRCNAADVDRAVAAAAKAFGEGGWADSLPAERGRLLLAAADCLEARSRALAELETRDTGKRIVESEPQIRYMAAWFRYFGGLADKIEGRVIPLDRDDVLNYTLREPLGVVAAVTPWNSPIMIAVWKIAPALAAGNTVVVKPSEHASASTLALMEVFEAAGFPPGVVNAVTGLPEEAGAPLVSHPDVAKVSFTGSDVGGGHINRAAADSFKHVTMELGGKSPQIVFADADLDSAVNGVIMGIFLSNGQSCVAGSRLIVQSSIADAFLGRLVEAVGGLRFGDPMDESTQVGPIANRMQFDKVLGFVERAKAAGAKCLCGGAPGTAAGIGSGMFLEPTIFTGITPDMEIWRDEVFGPVLAVTRFDDEAEAVRAANDSPYGLAAGAWTSDIRRGHRMAKLLKSGTVYVNTYRHVSVASPVGGFKRSGFGRENGLEVMAEYTQTKSVWIGLSEIANNPLKPQG